MGLDFHDTRMGHEFYMGTMPALVKAVNALNENLRANETRRQYVRTILHPDVNAEADIQKELDNGSRVEKMEMVNDDVLLVVYSAKITAKEGRKE